MTNKIVFAIVEFLLGIICGVLVMIIIEMRIPDTNGNTPTSNISHQNDEVTTYKIAIVNLDEGTNYQEKHINYANDLLIDLDSHFIFTGLEDARNGMGNGIYAGYIVVPTTFSKSVISFNDTPIRAELSYAINSNLNPEVKETVIYNIVELTENLNDKLSYLYLSSVMDEFHDAQDQATVIMKNDKLEKEAISAIQPKDIIALVHVSNPTEVPYTVEALDVSKYINKNAELTELVGNKYTEYIQSSNDAHQKLIEKSTTLMAEMGNMDGIISDIDFVHDSEGNEVYQTGTDELEVYFTEFNIHQQNASEKVVVLYENIQKYLTEYEKAVQYYKNNNKLFEGKIINEDGEETAIPLQTILENTYTGVDSNGTSQTLEDMNFEVEEDQKKVTEYILGEPYCFDVNDVMVITADEIINPIKEKVEETVTEIKTQYAKEKEQLAAFDEANTNYDPLKYIDREEIQGITGQMFENGSELSEVIYKNNTEQMEYVHDVYETSREDIHTLQEDIKEAKEKSDQAVTEGLKDLQEIKNDNSELNQKILYDFSEKLPYTKLGSLENTNTYEFMVAPLSIENMSSDKNETINKKNDSVRLDKDSVKIEEKNQNEIMTILLIISGMICVLIVGFTIMHHFHNKTEQLNAQKGED